MGRGPFRDAPLQQPGTKAKHPKTKLPPQVGIMESCSFMLCIFGSLPIIRGACCGGGGGEGGGCPYNEDYNIWVSISGSTYL